MNSLKNIYDKYLRNSFVFCLVWAFILNMIIETLARKGFGGIEFFIESPVVLYTSLIDNSNPNSNKVAAF